MLLLQVKGLKFVFRESESNGTYLISFADIKYFFTCGYLFQHVLLKENFAIIICMKGKCYHLKDCISTTMTAKVLACFTTLWIFSITFKKILYLHLGSRAFYIKRKNLKKFGFFFLCGSVKDDTLTRNLLKITVTVRYNYIYCWKVLLGIK